MLYKKRPIKQKFLKIFPTRCDQRKNHNFVTKNDDFNTSLDSRAKDYF